MTHPLWFADCTTGESLVSLYMLSVTVTSTYSHKDVLSYLSLGFHANYMIEQLRLSPLVAILVSGFGQTVHFGWYLVFGKICHMRTCDFMVCVMKC